MNYKEHHAGRKMSVLYTTKKKCRLFCLHGQKKRQSANSPVTHTYEPLAKHKDRIHQQGGQEVTQPQSK